MQLHFRTLLMAGIATIAMACAGRGATTTAQRNVVTAVELASAGDVNLYQALERIRPTFLRSRIGGGTTGVSAPEITVYLDDMKMHEGVEHLRYLSARSIQEVRFLEPQQANARFGGNNSGGALVIAIKK